MQNNVSVLGTEKKNHGNICLKDEIHHTEGQPKGTAEVSLRNAKQYVNGTGVAHRLCATFLYRGECHLKIPVEK